MGNLTCVDGATLERVDRLHREQLEFYGMYKEQLRRWLRGPLSPDQAREVRRLEGVNDRGRDVCKKILMLSSELKKGTINRIVETDDLELGLAILTGKIKPPRS